MNLAVTRPADPFLRLQPNHWPPHVELLLRAGIAVKHPQDGGRLKLVEFHL
jgi:centromere protein K